MVHDQVGKPADLALVYSNAEQTGTSKPADKKAVEPESPMRQYMASNQDDPFKPPVKAEIQYFPLGVGLTVNQVPDKKGPKQATETAEKSTPKAAVKASPDSTPGVVKPLSKNDPRALPSYNLELVAPKSKEDAVRMSKAIQADFEFVQNNPEAAHEAIPRLSEMNKLLGRSRYQTLEMSENIMRAAKGYMKMVEKGKTPPRAKPISEAKQPKRTEYESYQSTAKIYQEIAEDKKGYTLEPGHNKQHYEKQYAEYKNDSEQYQNNAKELEKLGIKDSEELFTMMKQKDKASQDYAHQAFRYLMDSYEGNRSTAKLKTLQHQTESLQKEIDGMVAKPGEKPTTPIEPERRAELLKQYQALNAELAKLKEQQDDVQSQANKDLDKKRIAWTKVASTKLVMYQKQLEELRAKKPEGKDSKSTTPDGKNTDVDTQIKALEGKIQSTTKAIHKDVIQTIEDDQKQIDQKRLALYKKENELGKQLQKLTNPDISIEGPDGKQLPLRSKNDIDAAVYTIQWQLTKELNPKAKEILQKRVEGLQTQLRDIEQTGLTLAKTTLERERLQLDWNEKQMSLNAAKEQLPEAKAAAKAKNAPKIYTDINDPKLMEALVNRFLMEGMGKEHAQIAARGQIVMSKDPAQLSKLLQQPLVIGKSSTQDHGLDPTDDGNRALVQSHMKAKADYTLRQEQLKKQEESLNKKYGHLSPKEADLLKLPQLPKMSGSGGSGGKSQADPNEKIVLQFNDKQMAQLKANAQKQKELDDYRWTLFPPDKPPGKETVQKTVTDSPKETNKEATAKKPQDKDKLVLEAPVIDAGNVAIKPLDLEKAKQNYIDTMKEFEAKGTLPPLLPDKTNQSNHLTQKELDDLADTLDKLGFNFMGLPVSMVQIDPNLSTAPGKKAPTFKLPGQFTPGNDSAGINNWIKDIVIVGNSNILAPTLQNPLYAVGLAATAWVVPEVLLVTGALGLINGSNMLAKGKDQLDKETEADKRQGRREMMGGGFQVLGSLFAMKKGVQSGVKRLSKSPSNGQTPSNPNTPPAKGGGGGNAPNKPTNTAPPSKGGGKAPNQNGNPTPLQQRQLDREMREISQGRLDPTEVPRLRPRRGGSRRRGHGQDGNTHDPATGERLGTGQPQTPLQRAQRDLASAERAVEEAQKGLQGLQRGAPQYQAASQRLTEARRRFNAAEDALRVREQQAAQAKPNTQPESTVENRDGYQTSQNRIQQDRDFREALRRLRRLGIQVTAENGRRRDLHNWISHEGLGVDAIVERGVTLFGSSRARR